MKESFLVVLGLGIGFFLIKKFLFSPTPKKTQGFRKRYEARKKEKNAHQ